VEEVVTVGQLIERHEGRNCVSYTSCHRRTRRAEDRRCLVETGFREVELETISRTLEGAAELKTPVHADSVGW
jgi:hypothetical protein